MNLYAQYNDEKLSNLIKLGDHAAFTEIFNRYSALFYNHAYNKLRNEEEARDIVQEVFINLWSRRINLDVTNNLSGYLYTAIRNSIFNLIKHKKVVANYEVIFTQINEQHPVATDYLVREKQFAELIESEIEALPPRMREVFNLRRKEYLSNKEISARMNITESTVADQMKKALRILRFKIGLTILIASILHLLNKP